MSYPEEPLEVCRFCGILLDERDYAFSGGLAECCICCEEADRNEIRTGQRYTVDPNEDESW